MAFFKDSNCEQILIWYSGFNGGPSGTIKGGASSFSRVYFVLVDVISPISLIISSFLHIMRYDDTGDIIPLLPSSLTGVWSSSISFSTVEQERG